MLDKKSTTEWFPFFVIAAMGVALTLDATISMVTLWLTTDTYMHGMFVIPLSFILAKRKPWPPTEAKPISFLFAIPILCIWILGVTLGKVAMLNVVQQVMLISLIPMTILLCYGWRIAWHYVAPLTLLYFSIPVGDFLIPTLQSITADMSVWFLQITGVSVLRNGWYISIPAADFRVAEACSGINFLISTFTVAVFYAFFYMEKYSKRIAFIFMGLIVPVVANGLRVYLIIMIADSGNVEAATGFDHLVYGWIFFVFILIALFAIGSWWQDPAPVSSESGVLMSTKPMTPGLKKPSTLIQLFLLITAIALFWQLNVRTISSDFNKVGEPIEANDTLSPKFPMADSISVKKLDSDWTQYQIHYKDESVDKKIIGYQNRWFDGKVWSIEDSSKLELSNGSFANKWELSDLHGRKGVLVFSYCINSEWSSTVIKTKLNQVKSRLLGHGFGGTAYAWFYIGAQPKSLPTPDELSALCH